MQKRPLSAKQLRVMMEKISVRCASAMQDIYGPEKVYDDLMAIRQIALDALAPEPGGREHRDVFKNDWGGCRQVLIEKIGSDETGPNNSYFETSVEPHADEDCPFRDGDVPMEVREP